MCQRNLAGVFLVATAKKISAVHPQATFFNRAICATFFFARWIHFAGVSATFRTALVCMFVRHPGISNKSFEIQVFYLPPPKLFSFKYGISIE